MMMMNLPVASVVLVLVLVLGMLAVGARGNAVMVENGVSAAWVPGSPGQYADITMSNQDVLFFNWTGTHNVMRMPTPTAYANCDFSAATALTQYTATMVGVQYYYSYFSTSVAGTYYFACGVGSDCSSQGMKVKATVIAAPGSPSASPSTPSPSSPSNPSSPSPASPSTTKVSAAGSPATRLTAAAAAAFVVTTALLAALLA